LSGSRIEARSIAEVEAPDLIWRSVPAVTVYPANSNGGWDFKA
jgi:hypothetical protein